MVLISLKDYAAERRVSYEAVRQQVKRYHAELEDHIIREGRQQFLDEAAVAFLDEKRQKNPVVIIQQDKDEQIETLNQQVTVLLAKTASQAEQIAELERWKADHALAIAKADQNLQLLAESREQLVQAQADNEANTKKIQQLEFRVAAAEAAKKALEDDNYLLQQREAQRENRTRWQKFKDLFK